MVDQQKYGLVSNIISFFPVFEKEVLDLVPGNNNSVLSPLLFRALHAIYLDAALLPSALSKRLSITGTNASRCIRKLYELGFITKTQDKVDKRIIHLSLTAKGTNLVETSLNKVEIALNKKLKVLNSEEIKNLSDAFATSRDLLIKIGNLHDNA